jgi:hypothetical protein
MTMNQLPPELADEAPLDPAAERVRRKMVRLLGVSFRRATTAKASW